MWIDKFIPHSKSQNKAIQNNKNKNKTKKINKTKQLYYSKSVTAVARTIDNNGIQNCQTRADGWS